MGGAEVPGVFEAELSASEFADYLTLPLEITKWKILPLNENDLKLIWL